VRKRLLDIGEDIPGKAKRGQQPLATLVKSEIARWTPIIKAANVKAGQKLHNSSQMASRTACWTTRRGVVAGRRHGHKSLAGAPIRPSSPLRRRGGTSTRRTGKTLFGKRRRIYARIARRGAGIGDDMAPILPVQCWIARTALGWSVRKLALAAEVSRDTVARFERGGELKAITVEAIQDTLERAGVVFIDAHDGGPSARLQR
jgi:hypothetical protein